MRILRNTLAALALAGVAVAHPAAAAGAAPLERVGSPTTQEEGAASTGLWIALGIIAAVALAEITGVTDIFGDDDPVSP